MCVLECVCVCVYVCVCVVCICNSHFIFLLISTKQGMDTSLAETDPADTWEWREGRLLTYELILKFFITNHVHYLMPASLLGPRCELLDTSSAEAKKDGVMRFVFIFCQAFLLF